MTRLKPVRGKAFPSSSDHGEAAEPRKAGLELGLLLLLPLFFADLALHKLVPRLDLSPAEWDSTGNPQCWDPHPQLGSETW